jgi:hypothetical protein
MKINYFIAIPVAIITMFVILLCAGVVKAEYSERPLYETRREAERRHESQQYQMERERVREGNTAEPLGGFPTRLGDGTPYRTETPAYRGRR